MNQNIGKITERGDLLYPLEDHRAFDFSLEALLKALEIQLAEQLNPIASVVNRLFLKNDLIQWPQNKKMEFWIAGSVFTKHWNDVDVFYHDQEPFSFDQSIVIATSQHTTTITSEGMRIQFCERPNDNTLKELIDGFDFTHVQCGYGFKVEFDATGHGYIFPGRFYFTEGFVRSRLFGSSNYVPGPSPLRSLIRYLKYFKRGDITEETAGTVLFEIVEYLIKSGDVEFTEQYPFPPEGYRISEARFWDFANTIMRYHQRVKSPNKLEIPKDELF